MHFMDIYIYMNDRVQKHRCSNWSGWIAAISIWHMAVQYYMKKLSWNININLNIYVLTLGKSNSDIEKDLAVHIGVLKSKVTA